MNKCRDAASPIASLQKANPFAADRILGRLRHENLEPPLSPASGQRHPNFI